MTPVFLLLLFFSMTAIPAGEAQEDISDIIEKANAGSKNLVDGDVVESSKRNAAICTYYGCKWPKSGSRVNVPVYISTHFSSAERNTIIRGLVSFHSSTCIRFVWKRYASQRDYIYFYSGSGCFSNIGRKGGHQFISLRKGSCVAHSLVQHEVLHALGFHHEHRRSDRDSYVQILLGNVLPSKRHNFDKAPTNNLLTPYDFNSVMHYSRYAFSRNGHPTIVGRNPSQTFGRATTMSSNDILRVNRLYSC